MPRRPPASGELGRASEPGLLILTSLASGAKHGYALAHDIQDFAGVKLGPGTLYGAITRLEERRLIEPVGEEERRRPYRLTEPGRAELAKALGEMRAIADIGAARLGKPSPATDAGASPGTIGPHGPAGSSRRRIPGYAPRGRRLGWV